MTLPSVDRKTFFALSAVVFVLMAVMVFSLNRRIYQKSSVSTQTSYEDEIKNIETQSQGDDINQIEKDLLNTDLDNMDKELKNIDQELNQSY